MTKNLFSPESEALACAFPFVRIEDKLGEGGQKFVFKARTQDGTVAFKIIKADQHVERIKREISAASRFAPPRFPKIFHYGNGKVENIDVIFIIEEFIEGISLRQRLVCGSINEAEVLKIGTELLYALSEIIAEKLVHRDIKPENIMLSRDGRVVLLDFGIARHLSLNSLTHDAALFGPLTPGYAAPEQIKNEKRSISPRTDLFSWGIVMYEMLVGYNPFTQGCNSPAEALTRTLNYDPPQLQNCSEKLAQIIDWCMKKPVHRRPINSNVVLELLKEVKL